MAECKHLVTDYLKAAEYISRAQLECVLQGERLYDAGFMVASRIMQTIGEQLYRYRVRLDEYEVYHNVEKFWTDHRLCAKYVHELIGVKV